MASFDGEVWRAWKETEANGVPGKRVSHVSGQFRAGLCFLSGHGKHFIAAAASGPSPPTPYSFLSPIRSSSCQHSSVPVEADLPVSDTGSMCAQNSALVMMPSGISAGSHKSFLVCRAQHAGHSRSREVWGVCRPSPLQSCRASCAGAS